MGGCPASLAALQSIAANMEILKSLTIAPKPVIQYSTQLYDTVCTGVGAVRKGLLSDDATLPPDALFTRMTVKVRAMGTNNYIGFGAAATPAFRFTGVGQSHTFIAPVMAGSIIPFKVKHTMVTLGDGANGVLEVTGVQISEVVL